MIFALMRYSHDALRGAVSDCRDAVERGDAAAFASEWEGYCRFQTLHQYMEDGVSKKGKLVAGGLWAILDVHFDDLAAKRGFRKLHTELDKLEKRVADASKQGSAEKLKDAWEPYEEKCLAHFAQEEMAVTPNIPLLPRNGIVLRDEMRAHILPGAARGARHGAAHRRRTPRRARARSALRPRRPHSRSRPGQPCPRRTCPSSSRTPPRSSRSTTRATRTCARLCSR